MFYSILLAGGHSSRMGVDKAGLMLDGQSLLDRSLSLLKAVGSERILVSGREGYEDSVADILPHCGPPGGLYACLDSLAREAQLKDFPLLLIPLDMPCLDESCLKILLSHMEGATACHFEGEIFPCVLRASEPLKQHLQNLFHESPEPGGKRSMRAILEFCKARSVPKGQLPADLFKNINTPEEYQGSLQAANGHLRSR